MKIKSLIVIRGLPGSGKSTKAKEILKQCEAIGETAVICSADDYFMDLISNKYCFDSKRLPAAHNYCRGVAEGAMKAKAEIVIIDNTNIRRWDFAAYLQLAKKYGYDVEEVIVGKFDKDSIEEYVKRGLHNIPLDTIEKMASRFEK